MPLDWGGFSGALDRAKSGTVRCVERGKKDNFLETFSGHEASNLVNEITTLDTFTRRMRWERRRDGAGDRGLIRAAR